MKAKLSVIVYGIIWVNIKNNQKNNTFVSRNPWLAWAKILNAIGVSIYVVIWYIWFAVHFVYQLMKGIDGSHFTEWKLQ